MPLGGAKDGHFPFFQRSCQLGLRVLALYIAYLNPCNNALLARGLENNQSNMNNHLIQNKSITVKNINYWPKSEDEGRRPRYSELIKKYSFGNSMEKISPIL